MASRPVLYSMDISHYSIAADRMLAFKGVGAGLRPHADLGRQDRHLVRDPGLPRGGPSDPDVLPVGPERPRDRPGTLGPPSPRGARLAVRRHEGPTDPQERPGALGFRGDADARSRPVARPRDAPRGIPAGHEQAPRHGRCDPRRPRLDPRPTEPRGLRDL